MRRLFTTRNLLLAYIGLQIVCAIAFGDRIAGATDRLIAALAACSR
jgi:hypothetical protein